MILQEGEDKRGKYFKSGLIGRYSLTLENYAGSDWGRRFYTPDFLNGFCDRRNEIYARLGKTATSAIVATTLLAFFRSVEGNLTIWGIAFSVPETATVALSVLVALNFYVVVCAFIDQLIIDRLLNVLGNRIGVFSFELALLDKTAHNLWVNALTPKYHGLASDAGHKLAYRLHGFFFAIFSLILILYPVSVVAVSLYDQLSFESGFLTYFLSGITLFLFLFSFLLILIFSFTYRFKASGLSEPCDPVVSESFVEMGHPFTSQAQGMPTNPPNDQNQP